MRVSFIDLNSRKSLQRVIMRKKITTGRLSERVRSLYVQWRPPVALLLVAVITVASVLAYLPLQIAAAVALLGLILQVLFEIDGKVTASKARVWYPSFQAALPSMTEEITKRLRHRPVRMRWIGVTHEAGWPFSQNILLEVLNGQLGVAASLQIELTLLDPDGQVCQRPDGPDQEQIRSTMEKISRFISSHRKELVAHRSSITLYTYDYRPTWHALLLDDDTFYYSTAMPQNLTFASPQGGVEVVKAEGGEPDIERIRHFTAWFESIMADARLFGKVVSSQPKKGKQK
jgi:hypothetical protein